ncbi:NUDIX hydrolase [Streptomyces tsukubensis]|uniref:NUDIX hydrolase n=1 Tax=Streptomyces tsukubensis TaxID=83656 RepID=UPI00369A3491
MTGRDGSEAPGRPGAGAAGGPGGPGHPADRSTVRNPADRSTAGSLTGPGAAGAAGGVSGVSGVGGVGGAIGAVTVSTSGLPGWLDPVVAVVDTVQGRQLSQFLPPSGGRGRPSAVLVLFGEGPTGPELLLMERAGGLRSHAGQPSFPGGALDPEDGDPETTGPLRAALREAEEETGLDPAGVQVFGTLPKLYIPVSGFVVTPVLGWWRAPSPVGAVDPAETARVFTVPVADLTDPANRATAVHPRGHQGPAFLVESALVWGFTAGVIDRILHFAGWERPWDQARQVPLDRRA